MAIVINGSGTVTGLAVGGLPDGTVDAGTLATNSVDSAELIDGAVDDSHMAAMAASKLSGTVATARMPTGSVLQVVSVANGTSTTISSTGTWVAVGLEASITPSSTSSKILVTVMGSQYADVNDTTASATIFRGSTNLGTGDYGFAPHYMNWGNGGGDDLQVSCTMVYLDSPSTSSAVTYSVKATTDKNTYRWNGIRIAKATITLMEIAG